jgi:hypothetical protein
LDPPVPRLSQRLRAKSTVEPPLYTP